MAAVNYSSSENISPHSEEFPLENSSGLLFRSDSSSESIIDMILVSFYIIFIDVFSEITCENETGCNAFSTFALCERS